MFAAFLVALIASTGWKLTDLPGQQMQLFATTFLDSLDDRQLQIATMPFESAKRTDWHFVPKLQRKGLSLRDMNDAQNVAAMRLLRSALSEAGYKKANRVMMLENTLHALETGRGKWERDSENYYVTIFGKPSQKGAWGLSFEGHHLSLNFVCRDGRLVDSTPQFYAANPATIASDVQPASSRQSTSGAALLGKGTRVLRDEEEFGFSLLRSLDETQRKVAIIAEEAVREIRFAGMAQADVGEPDGIAYVDLDARQRQRLQDLVDVYLAAVADSVARQRRESIDENGWQHVHFAWAGATQPGIGHYYRVQGKGFLIEFVNTQPDAAGNPANHIHCVYRDLTGDFDLAPSMVDSDLQ